MAEFTITSRRVLRYFVRSGDRRHAFSTIKAACRWLAIIELRKQVEPTVWRIFQDETRVWTTNESNDRWKIAWLEAYGSAFPPDENCPCCQRDYWQEDDQYGNIADCGYDSVATFCKTKRRAYIKGLADQIEAERQRSPMKDGRGIG